MANLVSPPVVDARIPLTGESAAKRMPAPAVPERLGSLDAFRGFGPYSYDLQRLLAYDRAQRLKHQPEQPSPERRSAS